MSTSTGNLKPFVIGIRLPSPPPVGATATLNLAARNDAPKEYKQFIYRRDNEFSTLSGVEDGIARKTLRFKAWGPNPDIVEVYLNGAKLEKGTGPNDFQVDDGSANPPAPSNTIKFNTPILPVGTFQVDVIVSKALLSDVYTLTLTRNQEDPNRSGAWDNVSSVERFNGVSWDTYYLFSIDLDGTSSLKKDTVLYPEGGVFVSGLGTVVSQDVIILLARKPYTRVDRYLDISVPLSTLGADRDYLKYHEVNKDLVLEVTETALTTNFPPSRSVKFDPELTIKTAVQGEEEQVVVDGSVVVGPDV